MTFLYLHIIYTYFVLPQQGPVVGTEALQPHKAGSIYGPALYRKSLEGLTRRKCFTTLCGEEPVLLLVFKKCPVCYGLIILLNTVKMLFDCCGDINLLQNF